MSPSESELRSFLHGGEGEPINPDTVITRAHELRHNRRIRLASAAAAVVLVGAVGTGALALRGGSDGRSAASSGLQQDQTAARGAAVPDAPTPAAVTCPPIPPRLMLPGGGGTVQFGSDGPLFDGPVTAMQICGYAAATTTGQVSFLGSTTLSGRPATEIATSLNAAATIRLNRPCPLRPTRKLIIFATGPSGAALKPVVLDYSSCLPSATNGTAARYDWTPPPEVDPTLAALMQPPSGLPTEPGTRPSGPSKSPVR